MFQVTFSASNAWQNRGEKVSLSSSFRNLLWETSSKLGMCIAFSFIIFIWKEIKIPATLFCEDDAWIHTTPHRRQEHRVPLHNTAIYALEICMSLKRGTLLTYSYATSDRDDSERAGLKSEAWRKASLSDALIEASQCLWATERPHSFELYGRLV